MNQSSDEGNQVVPQRRLGSYGNFLFKLVKKNHLKLNYGKINV